MLTIEKIDTLDALNIIEPDSEYRLNAVYERAEALGVHVILPPPNVLTVDLDNDTSKAVYDENIGILLNQEPEFVERTVVTTSRNGNQHMYIQLNRVVTELERLGLQAMLGSDPKREILGHARLQHGIEPVSVMFETEDQVDLATRFCNEARPVTAADDIPF